MEYIEKILMVLGAISTSSFMLIALGDIIVGSLEIIAKSTETKRDDEIVKDVQKGWNTAKKVWEHVRTVLDKFAIYSRPQKK